MFIVVEKYPVCLMLELSQVVILMFLRKQIFPIHGNLKFKK